MSKSKPPLVQLHEMTPGQAGDCPVAARLLGHLRPDAIVLADKAYDADWLRRRIEATGAAPNIPPMVSRLKFS